MNKNEIIVKLRDTELEILDIISELCHKHNLKYSLAYGTLIGAIRHKGFIPWDDDIDIIMPREDYEKLIEIWDTNVTEKYILQNKHTNKDFTQNFTKIRKAHTTFLQGENEKKVTYHTGIFVDIFPGDRVSQSVVGRKIQILACCLNILFARNFKSKTGGIQHILECFFLSLPEKLKYFLYCQTERMIHRWNDNKEANYFFPSTANEIFIQFPSDIFKSNNRVSFCKKNYSCVKDPDAFLKIEYGDYWKLPPVEERVWKHHPLIIDFDKDYHEIE